MPVESGDFDASGMERKSDHPKEAAASATGKKSRKRGGKKKKKDTKDGDVEESPSDLKADDGDRSVFIALLALGLRLSMNDGMLFIPFYV